MSSHREEQSLERSGVETRSVPKRRFSPSTFLVGLLCLICVGIAVAAALGYLDPRSDGTNVGARGGQRPLSRPVAAGEGAFDLTDLSIPREELLSGGPGKDGIPALSDPLFASADDTAFPNDRDRVIGVVLDNDARAFPLKILDLHEVVNCVIADVPVAVTWCPLCDSALVFDRRVKERVAEFGVSGLLYNSNVLMFDRNSDGPEGLWTQMGAECVSGRDSGTALTSIPCELTTWSAWRARHPDSVVLSTATGHFRRYDGSAYRAYLGQPQLMFPVNPVPPETELKPKERVLGIRSHESARAYPLSAFRLRGEAVTIEDQLDGLQYRLFYDPGSDSVRLLEADSGLEHVYCFWFAWYAFHPETEVAAFP